MKNRRVLIVSFILVACLTIGIGFAALTGSLRADGIVNIGLDNSNLQVEYTALGDETVSLNGSTLSADLYTIEYSSDKTVANITVKTGALKKVGDTVTFILPVINNSASLDAILKKPTVTMQGNALHYLSSDGTIDGGVAAGLQDAVTDGSVTLKCAEHNSGVAGTSALVITVELYDVPTETNVICNFSVAVAAESATVNE